MHRSRHPIALSAALLAMAAMPAPLHAQSAGSDDEITVAVGAGVRPDHEGSDDYKTVPGVLIRGKIAGIAFFSRGTNLFLDVVPEKNGADWDISFGPVANVRLNRTGGIGDSRVRALGELDTAVELGAWGGIARTGVVTSAYDTFSLRVAYTEDVAGAHKSHIVTPTLEYGTPLSETLFVGLSLSADYVGKGYGRYYYDISLSDSQASGLGVYGAAGDDAGFARLNLGLVGAKSLSGDLRKGWAIFALGGYGRILGDYADSPIVKDAGSRDQWLGGMGVAYSF
jgi:MipA family protein